MLLTLWRRAPAWRLAVFAGAAFTALAVMFPPPDRNSVPTTASFVPPPDHVANGLAALASPPPGAAREGVIPYAGRQLPLPAGQWRQVVIGRDEGAQPKQIAVFAQARATQFGGLLMAMGPDTASQASGILGTPESCSAPDVLAGEALPEKPGQNPFLHECWTLTATRMQTVIAADPRRGILHRGFAQAAVLGAAMPDRLLLLRYIRSTEFGWFLMQLYMPLRPGAPATPDRATVAWARKYAALLHRGYDGGLAAGQSAPALPREP